MFVSSVAGLCHWDGSMTTGVTRAIFARIASIIIVDTWNIRKAIRKLLRIDPLLFTGIEVE